MDKKPLYLIKETSKIKRLVSPSFNYYFDKVTGFHAQWGKTQEENPERSFFGPTIADIEVVSMCKGPGGKLCPFCYKANTPKGEYMTFEQYKTIFSKLPHTLTQIAFGADADCSLNPDLFQIMQYTRDNGVIPNITVADISEETANKLGALCGAVSVSWYGVHTKKDYCYDSIEKLSRNLRKFKDGNTLQSVNMHFMLSKETLPYIDELINDIKTDKRLEHLNAVVFLSLKQKGRGVKFQGCTKEEFKTVVDRMLAEKINFGFDSCGAGKFLESVKDHPNYATFETYAEPCESTKFSLYINEKGQCVPCSFMENMDWNKHSDVKYFDMLDDSIKDANDFVKKVWNSPEYLDFGKCSNCAIANGQGCHIYNV